MGIISQGCSTHLSLGSGMQFLARIWSLAVPDPLGRFL